MRRNVPQGAYVSVPIAIQVRSHDVSGLLADLKRASRGEGSLALVQENQQAARMKAHFEEENVLIAVAVQVRSHQGPRIVKAGEKIPGRRESPFPVVEED